jgi:DNA-binding transcriptional MocR family regulator
MTTIPSCGKGRVYLTEPPPGATFVMGYSSVTEDGIREGIALLAEAAG